MLYVILYTTDKGKIRAYTDTFTSKGEARKQGMRVFNFKCVWFIAECRQPEK